MLLKPDNFLGPDMARNLKRAARAMPGPGNFTAAEVSRNYQVASVRQVRQFKDEFKYLINFFK
jgi:hypothetical protein